MMVVRAMVPVYITAPDLDQARADVLQLIRYSQSPSEAEAQDINIGWAQDQTRPPAATYVWPSAYGTSWQVGCTACTWQGVRETPGRAEELGESHLDTQHPEDRKAGR